MAKSANEMKISIYMIYRDITLMTQDKMLRLIEKLMFIERSMIFIVYHSSNYHNQKIDDSKIKYDNKKWLTFTIWECVPI